MFILIKMTLYRKNKKQKLDNDESSSSSDQRKVTFEQPIYQPPPEKPKELSKVTQQDLRMLHMIFPGRNWVCKN